MYTDEEIKIYWGDRLMKIPSEILLQWSLPKETQFFLETTGLPIDEKLRSDSTLGIDFFPQKINSFTYEQKNYIVIGTVHNTLKICLREGTGEVFQLAIGSQYQYPIQFINSRIKTFLLFLIIYLRSSQRRTQIGTLLLDSQLNPTSLCERTTQNYEDLKQEGEKLVENIRQNFINIDSEALLGFENYWSMKLFGLSI